MGIGSTAWVAIEQSSNCRGFEIKESYWRMAQANVKKAIDGVKMQGEQSMMFEEEVNGRAARKRAATAVVM
jgi:hypothetical protein